MTEKFLHYIWQYRLFYPAGIVSPKGEAIEVLHPGTLNTDAGPDFFNAQIRIGETLWVGNVEIHTTTDEWNRHRHSSDKAYDNVILHVVGKSTGGDVLTSGGRVIPEIELRYPEYIASRYAGLQKASHAIRCADGLPGIGAASRRLWLDRLLVERFEERNERVEALLADFGGDWEQVFFALLARAMGFVVNAEPMEMLARATPVKVLLKHNNPLQMEAVLLGQAGMLADVPEPDDYTLLLQREYNVLRAKFGLQPLDASVWKRLRLRPDNFPAVRLSQLAAIIMAVGGNFESTFRTLDVNELCRRMAVSASEYWTSHYMLGRPGGASRPKTLGLTSRRILIVNAIIPFVFAYARRYGNEREQQNIIAMLQFMPIERNSRLDKWAAAGLPPANEAEAQALLLLMKNYCIKGRCLSCCFGHELLSRKGSE